MRKTTLHSKRLMKLFCRRKIATMEELKEALGTPVSMTVFRKLRQLGYCSSISNSGKYYCLNQHAKFNREGLWRWKSILFSSLGTLAATVEEIIRESEKGYQANEIGELLKLSPNEVLLELTKDKKIYREKIRGKYVYFSIERARRERQMILRSREQIKQESEWDRIRPKVLMNELKAAIIIFFSILNEKQRRLYAGLESIKVGKGGDTIISELLGINNKTVGSGRKELLEKSINIETIRGPGGGRKKILKKNTCSYKKDRKANEI